MAYALLAMPKTTNAATVMLRAMSIARSGTDAVNSIGQLGSSSSDQQAERAYILNEVQREILNRFPLLNWTSISYVIPSSDAAIDLPSNLRLNDVALAMWQDTDGNFLSFVKVGPLPRVRTLGDQAKDTGVPNFALLNYEGNGLTLYPSPDSDGILKLAYRVKEPVFTTADFDSSSVKYTDVPDELLPLFALGVAVQLAGRTQGWAGAETNVLQQRYSQGTLEWQSVLGVPMGQKIDLTMGLVDIDNATANPPDFDFWSQIKNTWAVQRGAAQASPGVG